MMLSSRNLLVSVLMSGAVAAIVLACGKEDESKFGDQKVNPSFGDSSLGGEGGPQIDLYANDPLPPWCGPETGAVSPPHIGGTEECPDDKNKPGCGCDHLGDTAPCWTGLRRDRNLGICHDGTTKCIAKNETTNVWGACEGEQLPDTTATGGKAACKCFSLGTWDIANTSPCVRQESTDYYVYSTVYSSGQATDCTDTQHEAANTAPPGIWSPNKLTVDCAGEYDLCFKIRHGDYDNPQATDCVIGQVCIHANYTTANVAQDLPDLPTWFGSDHACAKAWEADTPEDKSPGYGEMIVKGQTFFCDPVNRDNGDYVFHRVRYCPRICRPGYPNYQPDNPVCVQCQLQGKGDFTN